MKILHILTSNKGGAANATLRIHKAMLEKGINSKVLVLFARKDKQKEVYEVYGKYNSIPIIKNILNFIKGIEYLKNQIKLLKRNDQYEIFTSPYSYYDISKHHLYKWADIVNFHWTSYFLDYSFFQNNNKPIVWRLSDMEPFTGGCHIADGCSNFINDCRNCPQLVGTFNKNYAHLNHQYKEKMIMKSLINVVGVSSWISEEAKRSNLFGNQYIETINNGININDYRVLNQNESKKELSLSQKKKHILFIADDLGRKNKGFNYLTKVLQLYHNKEQIELLIIGKGDANINDDVISVKKYGYIADEKMINRLYSAADVTVVPSRYESFNQTTLESMACGTPVLAFNNSGPRDIIVHKETGYLAEAFNCEDMCDGLEWILNNDKDLRKKSRQRVVDHFNINNTVDKYINLYKRLLDDNI